VNTLDILANYKLSLEQLKQTKNFMKELDPIDFDLKSLIHTLDAKINKTENLVNQLSGVKNSNAHICGLCDKGYDEDEPRAVDNMKVCPTCREFGSKFRLGSDWEKLHGLADGTIKRDCLPIKGSPPKLQPFMDCGLIFKSGNYNIVHEKVIEMYYMNPKKYVRRISSKSKEEV
jgi:hypothetical protein